MSTFWPITHADAGTRYATISSFAFSGVMIPALIFVLGKITVALYLTTTFFLLVNAVRSTGRPSINFPSHRNTCKGTWFPQHCALSQDHERFRGQLQKWGLTRPGRPKKTARRVLGVITLPQSALSYAAEHDGRAAKRLHSSMRVLK